MTDNMLPHSMSPLTKCKPILQDHFPFKDEKTPEEGKALKHIVF